jgi:plasmid stabilization system protein ParE
MPRGDKSSYTDKQKRQAEHIEEGYEHRGVPEDEAERRAWATVNKETGGGKKSGSGRGKREKSCTVAKGRQARRQGRCLPLCYGALRISQEGSRHTQAQSPRVIVPIERLASQMAMTRQA